jgi:hypothetical protein
MELLFGFLVGHAVCDFVLQGEVISVAKARHGDAHAQHGAGFPPWYYWLGAHALTHGGAVYLVSGRWELAAIESVLHAAIDHLKCEGVITFQQDQALHLACKLAYVAFLIAAGRLLPL